jgi:hypothetical protein
VSRIPTPILVSVVSRRDYIALPTIPDKGGGLGLTYKEDNDVEEENQLVWNVSGGAHLGDSEPKSSCSKSDTTIV